MKRQVLKYAVNMLTSMITYFHFSLILAHLGVDFRNTHTKSTEEKYKGNQVPKLKISQFFFCFIFIWYLYCYSHPQFRYVATHLFWFYFSSSILSYRLVLCLFNDKLFTFCSSHFRFKQNVLSNYFYLFFFLYLVVILWCIERVEWW